MKALAYSLLLLAHVLVLPVSGFSQVTTVVLQKTSAAALDPVTITVPAGKVFETLTFSHSNEHGVLALSGVVFASSLYAKHLNNLPAADVRWRAVVAGPAEVVFSMPDEAFAAIGSGVLLTYKLSENPANGGIVSPIAGSAVVIPADAAGPVQIILESGTDLITWTAATPGSYGASTQKRFFRVRAVNQ